MQRSQQSRNCAPEHLRPRFLSFSSWFASLRLLYFLPANWQQHSSELLLFLARVTRFDVYMSPLIFCGSTGQLGSYCLWLFFFVWYRLSALSTWCKTQRNLLDVCVCTFQAQAYPHICIVIVWSVSAIAHCGGWTTNCYLDSRWDVRKEILLQSSAPRF